MPGYPRHHRHPKDLRKRDGTVRAVRLGGCLSTVVGFLAVVLVAAAGGWVVIRLLQAPIVEPVPFSPEDGVRAQQKIVGLVRRSTRAGSVVLSEAEINAFASRHLDPADLPLREPAIRLRGDDLVNIVGTVSLGRLLNESRSEERRVGKEWRSLCDWSSDVCSSDLAQQKIVGLVRRSTRAGSVVLSEAEINAFASRHLDPADLPLREPAIRLRGDDLVNIVGTVSLGRLLNES